MPIINRTAYSFWKILKQPAMAIMKSTTERYKQKSKSLTKQLFTDKQNRTLFETHLMRRTELSISRTSNTSLSSSKYILIRNSIPKSSTNLTRNLHQAVSNTKQRIQSNISWRYVRYEISNNITNLRMRQAAMLRASTFNYLQKKIKVRS